MTVLDRLYWGVQAVCLALGLVALVWGLRGLFVFFTVVLPAQPASIRESQASMGLEFIQLMLMSQLVPPLMLLGLGGVLHWLRRLCLLRAGVH